MKTVLLSALAGCALTAAAAVAVRNVYRAEESAAAARNAEQRAALEDEVAALRKSREALEARITALEAAAARAPAEDEKGTPGAAATASALEAAPVAAVDPTAKEQEPGTLTPEEQVEKAVAALLEPGRSWQDRQKLWGELAAAGLIDRAVEAFERRAKENPTSPDAQADKGVAYLQKLNTVVSDIEKGNWAMKADQSFDAALALDDQHWQARFVKASSLSYWPPATGKQGEAIRQFEILREQQEKLPNEGKFAETYNILGNLYQSRGEAEKARAVWKEGATRFPENADLAARAGEAEGK